MKNNILQFTKPEKIQSSLSKKVDPDHILIEQIDNAGKADGQAVFLKTAWEEYLKNLETEFSLEHKDKSLKELGEAEATKFGASEAANDIKDYLLLFKISPLTHEELNFFKTTAKLKVNTTPEFKYFNGFLMRF